jgi:hypothetical protein
VDVFPENISSPVVGTRDQILLYSKPYLDWATNWNGGYSGPIEARFIRFQFSDTTHDTAEKSKLAELVAVGSVLAFDLSNVNSTQEVYAAAGY